MFAEAVAAERRARASVEQLATIQERNRLAREIHDSLGHYLTVLHLQLEIAARSLGTDVAAAAAAVLRAKQLARDGLEDVLRELLRELLDAPPIVAFEPRAANGTIRFLDREGTDLGRVRLPWIEPEDRVELARRFGEMVERSLPPEQRALAAAIDAVSPRHSHRRREPPGLRMLHVAQLRPK